MKRTTILADEGLLAEVSALARRRGTTTSHAVREALERYVEDGQAEEQKMPELVGMFSWVGEPSGDSAEEYLEQTWPNAIDIRKVEGS